MHLKQTDYYHISVHFLMKVTNGTNTFLWASFLNEKGNKLEDRQNIERIVRGGVFVSGIPKIIFLVPSVVKDEC